MAKTALSVIAVPGKTHTFSAKERLYFLEDNIDVWVTSASAATAWRPTVRLIRWAQALRGIKWNEQ